uniref:Uncharacterized protein n=1 Tax=Clytia hemisphaerica TaxID=252671 RepID=A0A7M5V4F0_9CNID
MLPRNDGRLLESYSYFGAITCQHMDVIATTKARLTEVDPHRRSPSKPPLDESILSHEWLLRQESTIICIHDLDETGESLLARHHQIDKIPSDFIATAHGIRGTENEVFGTIVLLCALS